MLVELSPAVRRKIRLQGVEKFGEIDRDVGRGKGEEGREAKNRSGKVSNIVALWKKMDA